MGSKMCFCEVLLVFLGYSHELNGGWYGLGFGYMVCIILMLKRYLA